MRIYEELENSIGSCQRWSDCLTHRTKEELSEGTEGLDLGVRSVKNH